MENHGTAEWEWQTSRGAAAGDAPDLQRGLQATTTAYSAHPERFSKGLPVVAAPPKAVWINPPSRPNLP